MFMTTEGATSLFFYTYLHSKFGILKLHDICDLFIKVMFRDVCKENSVSTLSSTCNVQLCVLNEIDIHVTEKQ